MGMTDETGRQTPTCSIPSRSSRKHHWWRWVLASVVVIVILVVVAIGSFIKAPVPSPLALPTATARTPVGPLDGTWDVAAGSVGGFRVQQSAVGVSNDLVGRTNAVNGTITVTDSQVTSATLRIDLTTMKVGGKTSPQFEASLDTQGNPSATFALTQPMMLSSAFTSGATLKGTATGQLSMHGTSHPVTFTISERRDGAALQFAGSTPVALSDWGIKGPQGYGFLGSLANHGAAEVLLVLHRK
jgi:polyisoprenoid-binding protein YceI